MQFLLLFFSSFHNFKHLHECKSTNSVYTNTYTESDVGMYYVILFSVTFLTFQNNQ